MVYKDLGDDSRSVTRHRSVVESLGRSVSRDWTLFPLSLLFLCRGWTVPDTGGVDPLLVQKRRGVMEQGRRGEIRDEEWIRRRYPIGTSTDSPDSTETVSDQ